MKPTQGRKIHFALIMFGLIFILAGCGGSQGKSHHPIFGIPAIELTDHEKTETLRIARAALGGQPTPAQTSDMEMLHKRNPRGVFVAVARAEKTALTGFAMGESIGDGVGKAVAELKKLAGGDSLAAYPIRVDIVLSSSKKHSQSLDGKWKKVDISRQGILFDTDPPIGLLPQELKDRSILNHKGRLYPNYFKRALKQRAIPSSARTQLFRGEKIDFAVIDLISFMEDKDQKLVNLMRMNRAEGYEPTLENLRKSIDAAGKYLARAVREDGSFEYHYHPQKNMVSRDYNELRHAGTTFSMMQIYEVNGDPEVLEAAKKALSWLDKNTFGPDETDSKTHDWKALNEPKRRWAKLGGSGLSLLAFGWYTLVTGDQQYVPLMQAYARFVDYMVQENGDVQMRYWYLAKDKGRKGTPVLYYPGEAFFGLATLYKIDGNPRWIEVGSRGIDYIVDVRDKLKPNLALPHDHWMAYSIHHIHLASPKESHVNHAWRLFYAMDSKFNHDQKDPDLVGGYYSKPLSVRVGCRLEATTAFYRLAEQLGDRERMDRFLEVLQKGSSFLFRTQYDETNTMFFPDPVKPRGAMMRSYWEPSTQIDYTQHSVSSLIETYNILRERAGLAEKPVTQMLPAGKEEKPAA